ncbi:MAG: ParB/RepB/Spo0J family partition protein [Solirubrobacterales bacterium]
MADAKTEDVARKRGADKRGMGRGLSAILPKSHDDVSHDELRQLPVGSIEANPNQPRRSFDDAELKGLAESIKHNGVLQPLLVRPTLGGRYELVAGERRLRASRLAGLDMVPAFVRAGLDANTLELALIENMARVDLNPIDAARACAALVDDLGLTKEEVARRVGKSRVAVSNLIRLLNLPDEVIDMVEDGMLSEGHGRALLRVGDHFTRRRLAHQAVESGWSVRETERRAEQAASETEATSTNPQPKLKGSIDRDQIEAEEGAAAIAERLTAVLGVEPRVKVSDRGVKIRLEFSSVEEALAALEGK